MATKEGKRLYQLRAGVEAAISQGVRAVGLRRSPCQGLAKTRLQHLASTAALDLLRVSTCFV
jgi:transposase